jgi:putative heme-binding domain-containing protein
MLEELALNAFNRYPLLRHHFLGESTFSSMNHTFFFDAFPKEDLPILQRRIAGWVKESPENMTSAHIDLLLRSPSIEAIEVLRHVSTLPSVSDAVALGLAKHGSAKDRGVFIRGLKSLDPRVQKESAIALRKLIPDVSAKAAAVAMRTALRLGNEKQDVSIRDQMILLLRKFAGKEFGYQLGKPELRQSNVLLRWRAFLIKQQPELAEVLKPVESGQQQMARFEKLDWESGLADRGKQVYEKLQCAACHGAGRALGPRLEGVTSRLARNDLLTAIVNPDAQVSDRYRTTLFETVDGQLVSGSVIYENVDGVTVREPNGKTVRLNRDRIETRRRSARSMMPSGLLDQTSDQEVADLLAFLKTL